MLLAGSQALRALALISKPAWGPPGLNWRRLRLKGVPTSLKGPKKEPLKREEVAEVRARDGRRWPDATPPLPDTHPIIRNHPYLFSATIDRPEGLFPVGLIHAVLGGAPEHSHTPTPPHPQHAAHPH